MTKRRHCKRSDDSCSSSSSDTDCEYVIGPRGPKGCKGDRGECGPKGCPGRDGCPGERGPVGPVGPRGQIGPTGPSGVNGGSVIPYNYASSLNLDASGTTFAFGFGTTLTITSFIDGGSILSNQYRAGFMYYRAPRNGTLRNFYTSVHVSDALPIETQILTYIFIGNSTLPNRLPQFTKKLEFYTSANTNIATPDYPERVYFHNADTTSNIPVNAGEYIILLMSFFNVNAAGLVGSLSASYEFV